MRGRAIIIPRIPSSEPHIDSESSMMAEFIPITCPMILGVSIITMSMIIGPTLLIISFAGILSLYISPALKNLITRILNDSETQISLILECLIVGYVFAGMISIIVTHFFYGHCMMCEEEKKAEKEARKKQKTNQQGK